MTSYPWLDQVPLWGVFVITAVIVLLSNGQGTLMGKLRRKRPDHESEASLGTIIGATLALLAFMLAFTFGIASDRFQMRRQLLLDDVVAISTAWVRCGLLMEPHKSEVRKLLREYVDIRADLAKGGAAEAAKKFEDAMSRSEALQDQMWSHAEALAMADRSSEIDALFISSLNELIDVHSRRVTVFRYRIPSTIWDVLYCITILSMITVGYQAGLAGKSSFKVGLVLALTFALVILLIADLDRAMEGSLQVSQQPMYDLQTKMQAYAEPQPPEGTNSGELRE